MLELIWEPGTVWIDFGEADFEEKGRTVYLLLFEGFRYRMEHALMRQNATTS